MLPSRVRPHRPLLALPKRRISYLVNFGFALTALGIVRICRVAAVHIRPPCRGRRAYVMPRPLYSIQSAAALCSVQLHTHSRHQSRVDRVSVASYDDVLSVARAQRR